METHFRTFLLFCFYFCLTPIPVQLDTIEVYIEFLAENMKSPGSVKNYIYGLQTLFQLKGWQFPALSQALFRFQFKGIARSMAHTPTRATPLTPKVLIILFPFFNTDDPYECSMWAVVVLGFFLFARISSLLPPKKGKFDAVQQLTRSNVKVAADSIIINMKWSKTVQLSEWVVTLPLTQIPGSPLCPKWCLTKVCRLSKGSGSDHLFAYKSSTGLSTISQSEFIRFLRKKLKQAGLKSHYSGHSMRRGGAPHGRLPPV